jgi:hypothetical protein
MTCGLEFLQPVTRWRLAAVPTVPGQLVFESLKASFQLANDGLQFTDEGNHGVFPLSASRAKNTERVVLGDSGCSLPFHRWGL